MTFTSGSSEARADGVDELLGHETVGAAADDEHRAVECARGGRVAHPVVPDVDVVGGDVGCDGGADVGEPVELLFAEVGRQFGAQAALCNAVTAESAERRDHLVGQLCTAQRHRGEQHQSANVVWMLRGDQLGDLRAEALADDDHRPVDVG